MTGAPRDRDIALSRDSLLTRHPRTQRTIAGLVSITPEPPMQHRMSPSPPQQSPAPTAQAARLAMAASAPEEVSMAGSPSIELAWRVVQAAEARKALLDARSLSLRVRRTVPTPGNLNTTFPQKAMSPHYRDSLDRAESGTMRPPLPSYGGPLTPARRHHPCPGFPLLQVPSWLREDSAPPDMLRSCDQGDASPFSTALLERSSGLRKRRPKHPQRVVIPQPQNEEEDGDFSVSGVRLGTRRGISADFHVKAKKAFGAPAWPHGDPAALAEALTIALGQLQKSSWNEAPDEVPEAECLQTPEIEEAEDASGRPEVSQVRIQEDFEGSLDDDSPSATWPPGPKPRRVRAVVPTKALILRSKSLPGEKAEKEKVAEKRLAGEEDRQASYDKTPEKAPERTDKVKRPGKPLTLKSAAGAAATAAKTRKKAKKMVLPFSYPLDDARHWHVESTEGRVCSEFLPENRML